MSELILLHGRANDDINLQAALAACLPALEPESCRTVALLYTPRECIIARLEGERLSDSRGRIVALGEVFEARVFNEQAEMRWLHKAGGRGRALLLSEREIPQASCERLPEDVSLKSTRGLDRHYLHRTYLLWGEGVDVTPSAGWGRLTTARIGRLDVPLGDLPTLVRSNPNCKVHVLLQAKEYLAEADDHGNVAVCEERLCGLTAKVSSKQQPEL